MKLRAILTAILTFGISGCGPSDSEKKAKADLSESVRQTEQYRAEMNAKVESLNAELDSTKRSLEQESAELSDYKAKLDTELKKNAPKPEYQISGEVFIATKGGESKKLGLVEVAFIDAAAVQEHLRIRKNEQAEILKVVSPQVIKADSAYNTAKENESKAQEAYLAAIRGGGDVRSFEKAQNDARLVEDAKFDEYLALRRKESDAQDGEFFFNGMPGPLKTAKTNSDGKYSINLPRGSSLVICAVASRTVGESEEKYYWLLPVTAPAGPEMSLSLSNDNLSSSGSPESLISTQ